MHFEYHRPTTIAEAHRLANSIEGARFIAGGTDLLVKLKTGKVRVPAVISLRNIEELEGIAMGDSETRIGAMTPVGRLLDDPELEQRHPALVQAARELGSVQVRNSATLGGNLCNASPCADTAPPLLVCDARVCLSGPQGSRVVPLSEFFQGPKQTILARHELMTEIVVPRIGANTRQRFQKRKRVAMDLSIVSLAMSLQLEGDRCSEVRLAAGSAAPTPIRLTDTEAVLRARTLTPDLIAEARACAADEVRPISDLRGSAEYRRRVVGAYLQRGLEGLLGREAA
jgi:carbon-monoxide dehydrogenase medium subunit